MSTIQAGALTIDRGGSVDALASIIGESPRRRAERAGRAECIELPLRCVWSDATGDCSCASRIPRAVVTRAWQRELEAGGELEDRFFHLIWRGGVWLAYGLKNGRVRGVYCPSHNSERAERSPPALRGRGGGRGRSPAASGAGCPPPAPPGGAFRDPPPGGRIRSTLAAERHDRHPRRGARAPDARRPGGRSGARRGSARAPTASTAPRRASGSSRSTRRRRRSAARCTSGTSSPTRTPTRSPAISGCAGKRSSIRWAGTTTACPPSGACRTTSACAATPRSPTTPTSRRPRSPRRRSPWRSRGRTSSSCACA